MSVRQIGPYVLLHKLAEDHLSETYRAGLKAGEDVERVVLLCLFKAGAEDTPWISETASVGRNALKGLESPHLADIVDAGEVAGTAYLAYDYVSGVSLSRLTETAQREGIPVPLELALLIADRMAKGLRDAWQHESRMLHGFLVPPLVHVSSEGELRLLGFEVASRLRRLLSDEGLANDLAGYLAPEVVPQGQPTTADDVYSVAAILFELATGRKPARDAETLREAIADARLADGGELPDEVRKLLADCTAAPPRRAKLQTCAEEVERLVLSGQYDATSFNLALFMHRLFGEELEDDADAATRQVRAVSPEALAAAAAELERDDETTEAMDEAEAGAEPEPWQDPKPTETADFADATDFADAPYFPDAPVDTFDEEKPDASATFEPSRGAAVPAAAHDEAGARRRNLGIAASIAAIALVGAGALYFGGFLGSDEAKTADAGSLPLRARSQPTQIPPDGTDPDTAGTAVDGPVATQPAAQPEAQPTAEDMEQRVEELARRRSQSLQANMRQEYEQQINELKAQIEAMKTAPAATEPAAEGAPLDETEPTADATQERLAAAEATPIEEVAPQQIAFFEGADLSASTPFSPDSDLGNDSATDEPVTEPVAATETLASQTSAPSGVDSAPDASKSGPLGESADSPQSSVTQPSSRDEDSAPAKSASSASSQAAVQSPPEVKVGDLVSPGPGVTPPKLTKPVQPSYPLLARRLNKQAVVAVRVLVDENGKVTRTEQLGEAAGYGFDEAALDAASKMEWEPARKDGVRVKMWYTVRLAFRP